ERASVPCHDARAGSVGRAAAAHDDDVVAARPERPGEDPADLSAATGNHDLHGCCKSRIAVARRGHHGSWTMDGAHGLLTAITIVLCVAAVTTVVFQRLRQPVVLGYLL